MTGPAAGSTGSTSEGCHVMKLIALTFVCFLSDVLCKNETFLKTAEKAQKFKIAGRLFIIMTSSFMTMTNNGTPIQWSEYIA